MVLYMNLRFTHFSFLFLWQIKFSFAYIKKNSIVFQKVHSFPMNFNRVLPSHFKFIHIVCGFLYVAIESWSFQFKKNKNALKLSLYWIQKINFPRWFRLEFIYTCICKVEKSNWISFFLKSETNFLKNPSELKKKQRQTVRRWICSNTSLKWICSFRSKTNFVSALFFCLSLFIYPYIFFRV